MDDSRLADECTTLYANLTRATRNGETLTIGGGEFDAKLVRDILDMYIRISMKQGMDLASLKNVKEERDNYKAVSKELASEVTRLKDENNSLQLNYNRLLES